MLLIGGGGYVGVELQRELAESGYQVKVLDTFWYENGRWNKSAGSFVDNIEYLAGDIRDNLVLRNALSNVDSCIHLACISNDPSFELDPNLAKSINYDAFVLFIDEINRSEIRQLIYASSSSVYGVKEEENVTEDLSCEPLTDYSKYKMMCESLALSALSKDICLTILRPSTICGYSKRQRFDLVVNVLTISALINSKVRVEGGNQFRPNLHIRDMISAYKILLEVNRDVINRKIYNVAGENLKVITIAEKVVSLINNRCDIEILPIVDTRSYRVSGEKIRNEIGFIPQFSVDQAIIELQNAYYEKKFQDPTSDIYYNLRRMKYLILQGLIK